MLWPLAIAAGLVLLLALALSVPLELAFRVRAPGAGSSARCEWLFGLVGSDLARKERKVEERERAAEVARGRRAGLRKLRALLGTRGFVSGILRLLRRLLARIELRDLEGELRVGLDDPADTGLLCALAWPALTPSRLRLEPVFDGAALRIDASGRIRVVPVRLLAPLLAFAFSAATLRALWAMRQR